MSKKKEKKNIVSFVVGVNLDGPVVVNHDVETEGEAMPKSASPATTKTSKGVKQTTQANKRTCGQSNKSVRDKHKKK